jgi:anti-sigma factor RsiW
MCPDLEILSAFFDGEIGSPWNRHIGDHIEHCPECASRIASMRELRGILKSDPEPDFQGAFERVRTKLEHQRKPAREPEFKFWKRSIAIPIPVFAMSMALIFGLGVLLVVFQPNNQQNAVSVKTKSQSGNEMFITAPSSEEMEALLNSLEKMGPAQEVIFRLPEDSTFKKIGEPELLHAVDFEGNR